MKTIALLMFSLTSFSLQAAELRISSKEPLVVVAPEKWTSMPEKGKDAKFPFETYRIMPPSDRNAILLISVLDKDKHVFGESKFLQKLLRGDCTTYVNSPHELQAVEIKELKLKSGIGFYANFVDPSMVGKPVRPGSYKVATPIILSLESKYLIKITLLCDEINSIDYRELMKIVHSIKLQH